MADALETMNKKYVGIKAEKVAAEAQIKAFQEQLPILELKKKEAEGRVASAKLAKDQAAEKTAQDEVKQIDEQLKKIIEECDKEKAKVVGLKEKLDQYIEKVLNDPSIKAHLEEVLSKRYERQVRNIEEGTYEHGTGKFLKKGEKQVKAEKARLDRIKELIQKNPILGNVLSQIMRSKQKLNALNNELGKLDPNNPDDAKRIAEIQAEVPNVNQKITNNEDFLKDNFKSLFPKLKQDEKGENITIADLRALVENGVIKGSRSFDTMLDNEILVRKQQLDRFGREKRYYSAAMTEVRQSQGKKPTKKSRDAADPDHIPTSGTKGKAESKTSSNLPEPADKPKWWQFIKRFKNWFNRNTHEDVGESTSQTSSVKNTKSNAKGDTLGKDFKAELVRDALQEMRKKQISSIKPGVDQEIKKEKEKDEGRDM